MNKRLYVGNLPYETTELELRNMFSEIGAVSEATIISDAYSGRSKGFGFVEMATEESAATAMQRFNDTEVGGRSIKVAEARPRPQRYQGRSNYGYDFNSSLR